MDIQFSNEEFLSKFGQQVKSIRVNLGLSYREMAQRCDLDYSYISKIEKGQHNIQLSTVLELARGLEIHPQELFGFKLD